MGDGTPLVLWVNQNKESTAIWQFMQLVNKKYGLELQNYDDLHKWSVENPGPFWGETWDFTGMQYKEPYSEVLSPQTPMFPRPNFFASSTLNFAQNLLYPVPSPAPASTAILSLTETSSSTLSWSALRHAVHALAHAMTAHGIKPYHRVAGFLGNHAYTVIASLAATSIGAIWTGISADQGVAAVLERLVQIGPVLLFVDNANEHSGKVHEGKNKNREIVEALGSLKAVVVLETVVGREVSLEMNVKNGKAWTYDQFLSVENSPAEDSIQEFEMFAPDHPVYILYSSGTTGKPKCIIHSSAGTLIQHKKEHVLQCDIQPDSRMLYITTCSWMMWHWLVSALASGTTIVLFQGSPFHPHSALTIPRLLAAHKITHFGTSAAYLALLEQNGTSLTGLDLTHLKAIYSTGSPLAPSTFRYIYEAFPKTVHLGSITGGTDIISLFGAPSPISPVIEGEIQVSGLGMAIQAVDPFGVPVTPGSAGDLICTAPFPSQPVGFWGSPADSSHEVHTLGGESIAYNQAQYRAAYFDRFDNIWHHGDFVTFSKETGGLTMLGRSDGVLNPSGVRFGSAEIYNVLLSCFPTQIADALCVGRKRAEDRDETVVLFLLMQDGVPFTDTLKDDVKKEIATRCSRRHVPGVVDVCLDIPRTSNGKKVEVVVKGILCGWTGKVGASVVNSECLEWYREWAEKN